MLLTADGEEEEEEEEEEGGGGGGGGEDFGPSPLGSSIQPGPTYHYISPGQ